MRLIIALKKEPPSNTKSHHYYQSLGSTRSQPPKKLRFGRRSSLWDFLFTPCIEYDIIQRGISGFKLSFGLWDLSLQLGGDAYATIPISSIWEPTYTYFGKQIPTFLGLMIGI